LVEALFAVVDDENSEHILKCVALTELLLVIIKKRLKLKMWLGR